MSEQKQLVLIVDDMELNRSLLRDMLEDEYLVIEASNGREAIEILENCEKEISIVLLDVVMPEMDGFAVLAIMQKKQWITHIPVVMISAETSPDYITRGYELGAMDYISRPFDSIIVKKRVGNTLFLFNQQMMLQGIVKEQIWEKERNNALMINILSSIVEFRNGESGLHVLRIRIITEILLESIVQRYPKYDLNASEITYMSNAAALHDVGKIAVPDSILNKPGKLTSEEFEVMKTHTSEGAEMLDRVHFGKSEKIARYAYSICRWHHERWNGGGYPDKLRGPEIPLCAQVVSLADVYDALVSVRVYKPAYSHEASIQMIIEGACGVFNPDLIDCLLAVSAKLEERIRLQSENLDTLFNAEKIYKEIVARKSGLLSERTVFLLEQERMKYKFLTALSDEILFDFDASADTLVFSDKGRKALAVPAMIDQAQEYLTKSDLLSQKDAGELFARISRTTFEAPIVRADYLVYVSGQEPRRYEITVQALWSNESTPKFCGCIGKMVDIHEKNSEIA